MTSGPMPRVDVPTGPRARRLTKAFGRRPPADQSLFPREGSPPGQAKRGRAANGDRMGRVEGKNRPDSRAERPVALATRLRPEAVLHLGHPAVEGLIVGGDLAEVGAGQAARIGA